MEPELLILSKSLESVVRDHLDLIYKAICERAQELALQGASANPGMATAPPTITPIHCLKAISQIAPGGRVDTLLVEESIPFWHRFMTSISPITLISSILTIVFAAFGLWAITQTNKGGGSNALNGGAYLDIAKIFAGAIVGSASVAAVSSTTRHAIQVEREKGSKVRKTAVSAIEA